MVQIPHLKARLRKGTYRLRIRRQDVGESDASTLTQRPLNDHDVIHVVPIVGAAKDTGLYQVIAGVVMVAAAFYTGGASLAAWGAMSTGMAVAGASMVLSGVATMLAPVPDVSTVSANNGTSNQYFTSLENQLAQGSCVPVIVGEVMVGSKILSQGLRTE